MWRVSKNFPYHSSLNQANSLWQPSLVSTPDSSLPAPVYTAKVRQTPHKPNTAQSEVVFRDFLGYHWAGITPSLQPKTNTGYPKNWPFNSLYLIWNQPSLNKQNRTKIKYSLDRRRLQSQPTESTREVYRLRSHYTNIKNIKWQDSVPPPPEPTVSSPIDMFSNKNYLAGDQDINLK